MIALKIKDIRAFTNHLLRENTFNCYDFIEGDITTFVQYHINGYIQQAFFSEDENISEYSAWEKLQAHCFTLIKGNRAPLNFKFVLRLNEMNNKRFLAKVNEGKEEQYHLYLNIRYEQQELTCITGTASNTFSLDKSIEHAWDQEVQSFLLNCNIDAELC